MRSAGRSEANHPVISAGHHHRAYQDRAGEIVKFLQHHGYHMGELGLNILAIHATDKTTEEFGRRGAFGAS